MPHPNSICHTANSICHTANSICHTANSMSHSNSMSHALRRVCYNGILESMPQWHTREYAKMCTVNALSYLHLVMCSAGIHREIKILPHRLSTSRSGVALQGYVNSARCGVTRVCHLRPEWRYKGMSSPTGVVLQGYDIPDWCGVTMVWNLRLMWRYKGMSSLNVMTLLGHIIEVSRRRQSM